MLRLKLAILMQVLTVEEMMPAVGTNSVPMNISKAVRNNAGGSVQSPPLLQGVLSVVRPRHA